VTPIINQWGPVAVIVAGYLLGIYFQSRSISHLDRRIDDLRDSMQKCFDDLRDSMNSRFHDMNSRFDDMNSRFDDLHDLLKSEIKRTDERIDRLEKPSVRQ
jgi:hypothetical protein